MALVTRTLTNDGDPLCVPNGPPLANTRVTFVLVDANGFPTSAWDAETHERVVGKVTTTTDAEGHFTVELWPNSRGNVPTMYACRVNHPDARTFRAAVDAGEGALQWIDFMLAGEALNAQGLSALGQHIADTDGAHAASAISITAIEGLDADNVQAALAALKAAGGGGAVAPLDVAESRDLANTDHGRVLNCTAGVTLTIPAGLQAGFNCAIHQASSSQVTVAAGDGVTLHNVSSQTKTQTQYAMVGLINTEVDVYNLTGATGA